MEELIEQEPNVGEITDEQILNRLDLGPVKICGRTVKKLRAGELLKILYWLLLFTDEDIEINRIY